MDNKITIKKGGDSFIDFFTRNDSLVIFGGGIIAILIAIVFIGIFQAGSTVRNNVLFNLLGGLGMSILFIYLIFRFMGSSVNIMGKNIDMGMVVYIFIVLFIIFILGN
jgi:hypothetical protein